MNVIVSRTLQGKAATFLRNLHIRFKTGSNCAILCKNQNSDIKILNVIQVENVEHRSPKEEPLRAIPRTSHTLYEM